MQKLIYLNEYNIPTDKTTYLPYTSGLLQAYAQQDKEIKANYHFMPISFQKDSVKNIVDKHQNPSVVGFSTYLWNYQLNLAIAREIKQKFPSCIIIFGGPSAPLESTLFFQKNSFVDIVVYGEGEKIFKQILLDKLHHKIQHHQTLYNPTPTKNLDIFPSPYIAGIFDKLIQNNPSIEFKVTIETNRGCPFNCIYCFWGETNIVKKIGFHSVKYLQKEAEWFGKHKIKYVMCADANFGMYKQDAEIAQIYADVKKKYNYPERFRVDYGKNTTKNIFKTASILSQAKLIKAVTLSVQSNTPGVLQNINRKNIKQNSLQQLQQKYIQANIPTYTEVILGLPGETYHSFLTSLQTTIETIKNNQLFIYRCLLLPNTKINNKEYRKKFNFQTILVPISEGHGTVMSTDIIQEYEEVIIGTNTISIKEWKKCAVISLVVQLLHSLKLGWNIVDWLVKTYNIKHIDFYVFLATQSNHREIRKFWQIVNGIIQGKRWCQTSTKYGNIYYEPEEIAFLNILRDKDNFYKQLHENIIHFLSSRNLIYHFSIIKEINIQKQSLPNVDNFQTLKDCAKKIILYGRKSNKILSSSNKS